MKLVDSPISIKQLSELAGELFGDMTKAVVDINKKIMVVNAELHADEEQFLIQSGSEQQFLWGINLYPALYPDPDWIEFDSMINLRPSQGNASRSVEDKLTQKQIRKVVDQLTGDDNAA